MGNQMNIRKEFNGLAVIDKIMCEDAKLWEFFFIEHFLKTNKKKFLWKSIRNQIDLKFSIFWVNYPKKNLIQILF